MAVAYTMKFNSRKSSEKLYNSLNFAPCDPPYDPADRCTARSGYKLESPNLEYKVCKKEKDASTCSQEYECFDIHERFILDSL